jgi:hypothetical protein
LPIILQTRIRKVTLLKIKLDYIINGSCYSKTKFIVVIIVALLLTVTVSGLGGFTFFFEALLDLLQEGKISRALYNQILKAIKKKYANEAIPDEFLLRLT